MIDHDHIRSLIQRANQIVATIEPAVISVSDPIPEPGAPGQWTVTWANEWGSSGGSTFASREAAAAYADEQRRAIAAQPERRKAAAAELAPIIEELRQARLELAGSKSTQAEHALYIELCQAQAAAERVCELPKPVYMTTDELAQIGQRLHGNQWQSALARDLGMNDRSIRRMAAGHQDIGPKVAARVRRLLIEAEASAAIRAVSRTLAERGATAVLRLPDGVALAQGHVSALANAGMIVQDSSVPSCD